MLRRHDKEEGGVPMLSQVPKKKSKGFRVLLGRNDIRSYAAV